MMIKMKVGLFAVVAALALSSVGCGYSQDEMNAKQREIDTLTADLKAARQQIADDQKKYGEASAQAEKLRAELKKMGVDFEQQKSALEQALKEYKQRADQLATIEARFKELRSRLDKLNAVGVKVVVRNNRMVVQLPGDVLFDSGKDELKQSGKDVLLQVAEIIRTDPTLSTRSFQVAGHTDNAKYPANGPFKDNWGLSLARARQVLLFLTTPAGDKTAKDPKKQGGGGLDPRKLAAAGYGETDPWEGTIEKQTPDQMQKNRRVELVLQPDVEEMLNISKIH
jgi:chemotaxis protein MotB